MKKALLALLLLAGSARAEEGPHPIPFAVFASGRDRPFAVDVNGDGYADLLAFAGNDVWVALSDQGQKCRGGSVWLSGFASPDEPAAAADFDGDGRCDVLALKKDGTIRVGVSDGKSFTLATWSCAADTAQLQALANRPMIAADLDGDGFADLLFLPAANEPGPCVFLRNTGLRSFEAPTVWGTAPGDAVAGSFAGDGKVQLAWLRGGRVLVMRQGAAAPEVWAEGVQGPILAVGDMNGDGRCDLAVRGAWLLSHGAGFVRFADARLAPNKEAACSVGDLDGDGEGDLFVFTRAGECLVQVLLSRGPHFSRPEAWAPLGLAGDERVLDLGASRAVVGDRLLQGDGKLGVLPPSPAPKLALPAGPHVVATFHGRLAVVEPDRARSLEGEEWTRRGLFEGRSVTKLLAPDVAVDAKGAVLVALPGGVVPFALEPKEAAPLYAAALVGDGADLVARVKGGLAVLARDERLHAFREVGPVFRGPGKALGLADLTGDGRAELLLAGPAGDLLVARLGGSIDRDADGISDRDELRIYGSDPNERDTSKDGLVDGWKVNGFHGVRLDHFGASPAHKDLFLELAVEQTADMPRVERAIARMEHMFGDAPVENVDGTKGIAFHGMVAKRPPLPSEKYAPSRQELREMFFTPARAGIFHWMHLGARGGGGQADMLSDQGSCAGIFEAVLPHEFGHQLGLNHGGGTGMNGIPVYPSLMNYAYNYDLSIGYSEGLLSKLSLDENALSEVLDFPYEKLKYLAGGPFHFRVEPLPGGKTWVDWNRDGIKDEKPVRANINAVCGEGYGPRHILDEVAPVGTATLTDREPVLLDVAGSLALLYSKKDTHELWARVLPKGDDDPAHFGKPRKLLDAAGEDLSAVAIGKELHVFATQGGKVVAASGTLEGLEVEGVVGEGSAAAVARGDEVLVFLRAADGTISCDGKTLEGVKSACPPGVALDTLRDEVLLVTTDEKTWRLRLTRIDPETLAVTKTEPVGGPHASDATSRRPAVLFETQPWLPEAGRIDIFHAGIVDGPNPNTHMYRSFTIGDKEWQGRGGWKEDMTWNEWSYSTAGPGAALHGGHPWHADLFWWGEQDPHSWHVAIAPNADGICDADLHDFDDWAEIRDHGLERSILTIQEPRGRLAIGK
jgi:hypothetical protein